MATTFKLNDGNAIPWLGIGTGTALFGKDAADAVSQALKTGITHLDGAQRYDNEESLGAAVAGSGIPRSALFITTKLKPLPAGQTVRETLVESLKKLQTDYVDLFLIHAPYEHEGRLKEVWRELEEAKKDGLAKSIGVSNATIGDLKFIIDNGTVVPAVNQIEYHPYTAKWADPIIEFGKQHGIVFEGYAGLSPVTRHRDGPVTPVLEKIRERLEKTRGAPVTEGQTLLKWVSQRGLVSVTTTSKQERLKEYQDVVNVPELTPEEIAAISEAGYKEHRRFFMKKLDDW